jgi:predicted lipoprotein with Yx(FWY)xxD motif
MTRIGKLRGSLFIAIVLAAGLTAALLATRSGNASAAKTRQVVKVVRNPALGKRILVNRKGMTLYALSVERRGHFICTTSFCLSLWKPLTVPAGVKPTGASGLATVRRPDGKRQVAFKGAPLYRFVQDMKPGDVKGNGFKDVGVWRPVAAGRTTSSAPAPAPAPASSPSYGY